MPLVCDEQKPLETQPQELSSSGGATPPRVRQGRRQSQHSLIAKSAIMSSYFAPTFEGAQPPEDHDPLKGGGRSHAKTQDQSLTEDTRRYKASLCALKNGRDGVGAALTDTPATTAPNSPRIPPIRQDSGNSGNVRSRPTTLDIPGLTKSKVSPDGRIAQRDVGSKLVIVMVGLPARGKSYVTKKIARYLNWLQHDTKIFNVGERRRVAAGAPARKPSPSDISNGQQMIFAQMSSVSTTSLNGILNREDYLGQPAIPATILVNGEAPGGKTEVESAPLTPKLSHQTNGYNPSGSVSENSSDPISREHTVDDTDERVRQEFPGAETMEQSASFFDPENVKAAQIREQVAMSTLDELLDYILYQGGSVGIFDATNSTVERRKLIIKRVRERAGPELGILFLESLCVDERLLESNMRLKLSGPDYKDKDPVGALADFKERVALYQKKYKPLGKYEEDNDIPYIQMIDVGRKVVSHQIRGFLSAQTVYYLLNFNLAPRQIWITRHGESIDNINGKIGGDSELSENGHMFARALTRFMKHERKAWDVRQRDKALSTHFPPLPGDTTPPNPEYLYHGDKRDSEHSCKSFCVWTSMLKRSIETAQYFDEEDFDIKQMKMLDELNAGMMEGMTYDEIRTRYAEEYAARKRGKLHYRYPGAGGEGYLDIINRLRAVIVEVERMTDHVLLVGHRSVARVLLAYFMGLEREDVADLGVPLGMLYMLEPKPYGVEFRAYRYNSETDWFDEVKDYELKRATGHWD